GGFWRQRCRHGQRHLLFEFARRLARGPSAFSGILSAGRDQSCRKPAIAWGAVSNVRGHRKSWTFFGFKFPRCCDQDTKGCAQRTPDGLWASGFRPKTGIRSDKKGGGLRERRGRCGVGPILFGGSLGVGQTAWARQRNVSAAVAWARDV